MNVTIEVSDNRIADLLCSALEGGSNYWCQIEGYVKPDADKLFPWDMNAAPADGQAVDTKVYRHVQYPMSEGGAVLLQDTEYDPDYNKSGDAEYAINPGAQEAGKPGIYRLDLSAIQRGLNLFASDKRYAHHYGHFIGDDGDATTGDVFLQFCLFGNVIYS